jgi:hypothetical protein
MSEEAKKPVRQPKLLRLAFRGIGNALAAYALFTGACLVGHHIVEVHHKPLIAKITLYGVALTGDKNDLVNAARLQDLSDEEFSMFLVRMGYDDSMIEEMLVRRSMSEEQWRETKAMENEIKNGKW